MTDKNGGAAFPCAKSEYNSINQYGEPHQVGMTLRDYFAGQALAGLPEHLKVLQTDHRIKIAEWVYGLADAMIAAREE